MMTPTELSSGPLLDHDLLRRFVERHQAEALSDLRLDVRPLRGGLEAAAVARVQARFHDRAGRARGLRFVVKRLEGAYRREASVYETLATLQLPLGPRLLGIERIDDASTYLYLEWIRAWSNWPWRDPGQVELVMDQLARLHRSPQSTSTPAALASWDYETELVQSAELTLEYFEQTSRLDALAGLRRALPSLRRVVASLPRIRLALFRAEPRRVLVHGDAHPGNAVILNDRRVTRAVLLDWGRARMGSPLEDVSSWLQSLGYYEPAVKRLHDTLLQRYLRARGTIGTLSRDLRDAYWLASVSNVLAGALRYHLVSATRPDASGRVRLSSARAAQDCLRIVRRADACWRS